jgi:hypothetical protein
MPDDAAVTLVAGSYLAGGSRHRHGSPPAFSMYSRSTRQLRRGTSSSCNYAWTRSRRFPKRFDWAARSSDVCHDSLAGGS